LSLNSMQRVVLLATAFTLLIMLLFPPLQSLYLKGIKVNAGYSFICKPPVYELGGDSYKSQVNMSLPALQCLVATTVGGLFFCCIQMKMTGCR